VNILPLHFVVFMLIAFITSFVGTYCYRTIAIRKGVLANPNFRTLHKQSMPRGGGVVFSLVFVIAVILLGFLDVVDTDLVLTLGIGGGLASIFGFIDDVAHIRASIKFAIQSCLAVWIMICFDGGPLVSIDWLPVWLAWLVSWFLLVWMINLYNFIDGVDGMASSGAFFICTILALILVITDGSPDLLLIFSLLAVSCVGFLLFNWPPASIFMGDSGSVFLGYCFGALIIKTTMISEISFLTWLVILGYFIGDTTTTTCIRVLKVKKWYGAHRSHAYQNLARIWDSHFKVTISVVTYHIVWLLPLAIWSSLKPIMAPLAVVLALLPSIYWAFRFGPLLSSE
jgi:Fuc2NAc and GlcNAc transferase